MKTEQRFMDGVEMNRQHPDSFKIPTDEEKAAIRPGDFVKVGFTHEGHKVSAERMWLEVTGIAPDGAITGDLNNDPVIVSHKCGDAFTVHPDHVLSILAKEDE